MIWIVYVVLEARTVFAEAVKDFSTVPCVGFVSVAIMLPGVCPVPRCSSSIVGVIPAGHVRIYSVTDVSVAPEVPVVKRTATGLGSVDISCHSRESGNLFLFGSIYST